MFVRETRGHARHEAATHISGNADHHDDLTGRQIFTLTSFRERALSAASQAGLVNNLNDGLAWTQLAASTGSACHSGATEPSPVLTAMGLDPDHALGAIRLSLGRWTTTADVDRAADLLATAAHRLRSRAVGTAATA